jgi:hypothetical protein
VPEYEKRREARLPPLEGVTKKPLLRSPARLAVGFGEKESAYVAVATIHPRYWVPRSFRGSEGFGALLYRTM